MAKRFAQLIAVFSLIACYQSFSKEIEIRVNPPKTLSEKDEIYLVGNLNDWQLNGEQAIKLTRQDDQLVANISTDKKDLFFTFIKNKEWQHMPASTTGNSLCTFHFNTRSNQNAFVATIPAWKTDTPREKAKETIKGTVEFVTDFDMPQLNRSGDIAVYLPPSYNSNSNAHYPVLYMLDGQNLFSRKTAYSDEWQIDETMEELIANGKVKDTIVVAIPNGPNRWNEYNPWDYLDRSGNLQQGKGANTMAFIKNQLKPYIDLNFRTLKGNINTGLAGSSLGGLMALYAAIEHSQTFGFVAAFSPSLAIVNANNENVLLTALKAHSFSDVNIYVDMGKLEYDGYKEFDALIAALNKAKANQSQVLTVKDDIGRHCELDWSKRFPKAVSWLIN